MISLLINNSPYSHGMKGTDERDAMFARLFGLTAIIQSGALFASGAGSANDFRDVMAQIVAVGQAKGWLRESAWWTLLEATERLLASKVEWKGEAVDDLVAKVFGVQGWTQEKVALALILERGRPVSFLKDPVEETLMPRLGSQLEIAALASIQAHSSSRFRQSRSTRSHPESPFGPDIGLKAIADVTQIYRGPTVRRTMPQSCRRPPARGSLNSTSFGQ